MDSSELRGTVYKTEAEAIAACDAIDLALGLPNEHMDRWTLPVPAEGGWFVQSYDGRFAFDEKHPALQVGEVLARTKLVAVVDGDAVSAKVEAMVATQEAKTRAIKGEPAKVETAPIVITQAVKR